MCRNRWQRAALNSDIPTLSFIQPQILQFLSGQVIQTLKKPPCHARALTDIKFERLFDQISLIHDSSLPSACATM